MDSHFGTLPISDAWIAALGHQKRCRARVPKHSHECQDSDSVEGSQLGQYSSAPLKHGTCLSKTTCTVRFQQVVKVVTR
jgi:hypothetical protein